MEQWPAGTIPAELAQHPDYKIIRELGRGGMGVVYLAHNEIMGRDEVLKVIGPDVIERPGVLDRFQREMRTVASLQHPNIVCADSAFRAGGNLVFAMEYVDGLDLAKRVKAKGPMPVRHACYFVHQAALGLQHAHEAGIVHRDIKPGNLMLTYADGNANVKVLDFGLAKVVFEQKVLAVIAAGADDELRDSDLRTQTRQLLGTPDFIAPEQITDAQSADIRADIYSLGCTLYYLLSGRPPFQAAKLHDVLQSHQSTDARLLNLVRPEVPAELAGVVAKMMAKEADNGFQTPSEVAKALIPFFTQRSAATVSPNLGVDPVVAPAAGFRRGRADRGRDTGCDGAPTAAAGDKGLGMRSSLDELKQTEEHSAGVTEAAKPARARNPRRRRMIIGSVGCAAAPLVGTIIVVVQIRPDSDTPAELVAPAESEHGLENPPVETSSSSPVVSMPYQNDAPIPPPLEKPPGPPPPIVAGPPPTPAPLSRGWLRMSRSQNGSSRPLNVSRRSWGNR